VFLLCGLAPLSTVAWVLAEAGGVLDGRAVQETVAWAPTLGLDADLRLDAFGLLMVLLVSGIGTLIFGYAHQYFSKPRPDLGKFAGALTAFAGSMLGLVLADNLLLLFVFWELTSITSYLLIGFDDRKAASRDAALQALLTTGLGGLAMLGGLVVLGQMAGTYSMSAVLSSPPADGGLLTAALVLILAGAFTKSAQAPFHTWLPGAMAAPTPVSAYLHSATMVKAGIYLIARMAPAFAEVPVWRPLVVTVGVVTMLIGGYRALRQHDLKLLLAFGTISQLGFMVALFGAGTPETVFAGTALLLTHGMFKAALFMIVGIVDHEAHTRDLRRLDGLYRLMPVTFAAAVLASASMAGLPPLLGFIAKEAAFEALVHGGFGSLGGVALGVIVLGSTLTFAYTARFVWGAFASKPRAGDLPLVRHREVHSPPGAFVAPAAGLAALGLVFGLLPGPVEPLVNLGATALHPGWEGTYLALWHGFNLPLALSALVVAAGSVLFVWRVQVERLQALPPALPGANEAYRGIVRNVLLGAKRVTGFVQSGSLPVYLSIISVTLVLLPGVALVTRVGAPAMPPFSANPMQTVLTGMVMVAALAAALARRRFIGVLLLGAVGYGVGLLFVVQGAPDLALTQFLIETLILVIFMLVLRHLPTEFTRKRLPFYRAGRALVATGVGVFVTLFSLMVAGVRTQPPVSDQYLARAYTEAEGANVVNVILVDFRALDTLGEIVVLLVAGVGIASLVMAAQVQRFRTAARGEADALEGEAAVVEGEAP
jgi:multicomponent Na+:H+ antiporter subunit A